MGPTSSSDTWVLLAILYGDGEAGRTLREVIATADYLNHAVPTYEELAGGLARLLAAGLAVEHTGRYRASARISTLYDDLGASHWSLWPLWDELERVVQARVSAAPTSLPFPVISRATYEEAVQVYIQEFGQ
jgi:hypothetical protein